MDAAHILSLIPDIVQVLILYFVFYSILKAAKGSRFGQVLMGAGILFALLFVFTYLFNFDVLAKIIQTLLLYLILSSVVIFQPEIRRTLATMGSLLFQDPQRMTASLAQRTTPEELVGIIFKLAKARTGALIAFERGISLRGFDATGVELDARMSTELFFSIFTEPMPLHDGGVVIRKGRIAAAHCLFPVSNQSELSSSGMRHRAAVGLSEETDALVLVVSEETGRVSVAHNGRLIRYPGTGDDSRQAVLRWVRKAMPLQRTTSEAVVDWFQRRRKKLLRAAAAEAEKAEKTDKPEKPEKAEKAEKEASK